jgi:cell division septum initiation protein DivIVA
MMTREERAEIRARVYRMGKATTQDAQLLLDSHDEADRVIEQLREALEGATLQLEIVCDDADCSRQTSCGECRIRPAVKKAQAALAAGQGKEKP